jgi:hypothetical protein
VAKPPSKPVKKSEHPCNQALPTNVMSGGRGWGNAVSIVDLLKHARETRDLAFRAKRLAQTIIEPADKARILRYADELLAQAQGLESQAARSPRFPTI